MFVRNIKIIFILLLMISVGVNNENSNNNETTKKGTTIYSIADVLQTLLKLNEARYNAFKKLNSLNNIHYMRTFSEKDNENNIWEFFREIASFFKLSFKPNLEKDEEPNVRYYDVYHDNKYIFTIPVPKTIDLKKVHLSVSPSSDEKNNYVKKNTSLRYYECRRGNTRCKSACREALMMACIILPVCTYDFYMQKMLSCKYECEDRFY